jgi:hypothetical protein
MGEVLYKPNGGGSVGVERFTSVRNGVGQVGVAAAATTASSKSDAGSTLATNTLRNVLGGWIGLGLFAIVI